jgi:hypothetical protein
MLVRTFRARQRPSVRTEGSDYFNGGHSWDGTTIRLYTKKTLLANPASPAWPFPCEPRRAFLGSKGDKRLLDSIGSRGKGDDLQFGSAVDTRKQLFQPRKGRIGERNCAIMPPLPRPDEYSAQRSHCRVGRPFRITIVCSPSLSGMSVIVCACRLPQTWHLISASSRQNSGSERCASPPTSPGNSPPSFPETPASPPSYLHSRRGGRRALLRGTGPVRMTSRCHG